MFIILGWFSLVFVYLLYFVCPLGCLGLFQVFFVFYFVLNLFCLVVVICLMYLLLFSVSAVGSRLTGLPEGLGGVGGASASVVDFGGGVVSAVSNALTKGLVNCPIVLDETLLVLPVLIEGRYILVTNGFASDSLSNVHMTAEGFPRSDFLPIDIVGLLAIVTSEYDECKICSELLDSPLEMLVHLAKWHLLIICSLCFTRLPDYFSLWRHVAVGDCSCTDFVVGDCDSAESVAAVADRRLRAGNLSSDTRQLLSDCMQFSCPSILCGGYFVSRLTLDRHIYQVHTPHDLSHNLRGSCMNR